MIFFLLSSLQLYIINNMLLLLLGKSWFFTSNNTNNQSREFSRIVFSVPSDKRIGFLAIFFGWVTARQPVTRWMDGGGPVSRNVASISVERRAIYRVKWFSNKSGARGPWKFPRRIRFSSRIRVCSPTFFGVGELIILSRKNSPWILFFPSLQGQSFSKNWRMRGRNF